MSEYYLNTSNINEWVDSLKAGDRVYLSGTVYTARDAAHKKIFELLDKGEKLPFELENSVVYYAGPTPAKNNLVIGSIGPTTSSRMDPYAPLLLDTEEEKELWKFVKAADKLSAYIKCIEEIRMGNMDFEKAGESVRSILEEMDMPEVKFFMDKFIPAYMLTIDESK